MKTIAVFLLPALLSVLGPAPVIAQKSVLVRADSLWTAGMRAESLTLLETTLDEAIAAADSARMAAILIHLGARRVGIGQLSRAAEELGIGARLARSAADTSLLLPALRWWSLSSSLRGHTAEADSLTRELYRAAWAADDDRHLGWACVGLASRQLDKGRPDRAADWYRKAVSYLMIAGETEGELWARNGLGITLNQQRRFREAQDVYREVAARARATGAPMAEANAVNNLGNQRMLLGDPGRAQADFRRAVALFDSLGLAVVRTTPALNLALCEMELGNFDSAAAILDSNLVFCRTRGLAKDRGRFLIEKGRLEEARGRYHAARRCYEAALAMGDSLPATERGRAVANLARTAGRLGRPGDTLEILDTWQPRLPAEGLGIITWELEHVRAEALLEAGEPGEALALLQSGRQEIGAGGIDRLTITTRLLNARALRDLGRFAAAVDQLRAAADTWEQQREKPGEFRWREVRAGGGRKVFLELSRLLLEHPELSLTPDNSQAEVFGLLQNYKGRTLLERTAGPAFADSLRLQIGSPTGLGVFQQGLAPGDLVLDWYTGPDFSLLLAITSTGIRPVFLPGEKELDRRTNLYLEMLALYRNEDSAGNQAPAAASEALAGLLLQPVADLLHGAEHVVNCPDGPLHRLPLEIVCLSAGLFPGGNRNAWSQVPSLAFLSIQGRQPSRTAGGILLLAGTTNPDGTSLPGPAAELGDLRRRFAQVEYLLFREGDPPLDPGRLPGHHVLHLASHVVVNHRQTWQSAIDLPFAGLDGTVGPLAAEQLLTLDLDNDLTVLNGCGTADGRIMAGEGTQSLAAAFLVAGSRCVLATRWPVDDRTARKFSRAFYDGLAKGLTVEAATATARDRLRLDPATAAPLQWGAYVVFGDGGQQIHLVPRRTWPGWAAMATLGLGLAGAALLLRKRRS